MAKAHRLPRGRDSGETNALETISLSYLSMMSGESAGKRVQAPGVSGGAIMTSMWRARDQNPDISNRYTDFLVVQARRHLEEARRICIFSLSFIKGELKKLLKNFDECLMEGCRLAVND